MNKKRKKNKLIYTFEFESQTYLLNLESPPNSSVMRD